MNLQPAGHDLLMRLLSASALRRDVIAANVASQNVPGYRRQDVRFEHALAEAMQSGARPEDLGDIRPEVEHDYDTPERADGNNVTPEMEATLLRENRIRFELYASILQGRTRLVERAILGDR